MSAELCILGCQNFRQEVCAASAAEGWPDVAVAAFPARCGRPPLNWEELRVLLPQGCTQIAVLGRACIAGLEQPPADFPPVRLLPQEQCFNMVADSSLVTEAATDGGYLITPGWLADWRRQLADMGFAPENSGEFFKDFARKLVLFDTGVDAGAQLHLGELASAIDLPATRVAVGLDHIRLLLARIVLEWRLDVERLGGQERDRRHARELADHVSAMDLLARLGKTKTEAEAIAAIEEMFRMLFAPATWHYLRVEHGQPIFDPNIPTDLLAALQRLESPFAWTASGQGFLLRITRGDNLLGLIVVDGFAFPEYRERYLNTALAMTGVCALAIEDARVKAELEKQRHHLEDLAHYARSLIEASLDPLVTISAEGTITDVNVATEQATGVDRGNLIGSDFADYFTEPEKAREAYRQAFARGFVADYPLAIRHVSAKVAEVLYNASVYRNADGNVVGVSAAARDITERKRIEDQVHQMAFYDLLTKLPNRRLLNDRLSQAIAASKRSGSHGALMFLDLDNFKSLNETQGHEIGDLLLIEAATRLKACVREADTAACFGGDEFVVLIGGLEADRATSRTKAEIVAEKIRAALARPYVLKIQRDGEVETTIEHHCSASIGVALFVKDDASRDTVLKRADTAMYQAKEAGRNLIRFYDSIDCVTALMA